MIRSFADPATEDIFDGRDTRRARRTCPTSLWAVATRKLEQSDSIGELGDLRVPPGSRLERLGGTRRGQYSIPINQQYRVWFRWDVSGTADVEIVDYH